LTLSNNRYFEKFSRDLVTASTLMRLGETLLS
jgi:hypothetical protein